MAICRGGNCYKIVTQMPIFVLSVIDKIPILLILALLALLDPLAATIAMMHGAWDLGSRWSNWKESPLF